MPTHPHWKKFSFVLPDELIYNFPKWEFLKNQVSEILIYEKSSEFEVNNWIVSEFVVDKLVPVVGMDLFQLNELMLMSSAVCRLRPELILDWGTNISKSARIFYEIIKKFDDASQIASIDLPNDVFHNEHPEKDRREIVCGLKEVTLHQEDGENILDLRWANAKIKCFCGWRSQ